MLPPTPARRAFLREAVSCALLSTAVVTALSTGIAFAGVLGNA
jgi:hypothetical protein